MKTRGMIMGLACLCAVFVLTMQPCFAKEAKTVNIGGLFCLTGFGSSAETYIHQGAKIAEEWYNERGGITIKGEKYKIRLLAEDMKGTRCRSK